MTTWCMIFFNYLTIAITTEKEKKFNIFQMIIFHASDITINNLWLFLLVYQVYQNCF